MGEFMFGGKISPPPALEFGLFAKRPQNGPTPQLPHLDQHLLDFYRKLIAMRRGSTVLQRGGFQVLSIETDTLVYQREGKDGRYIVAAHRGSESPRPAPLSAARAGISIRAHFRKVFSGQET